MRPDAVGAADVSSSVWRLVQPREELRPASDDHRVDDQVELIEQAFIDQAREQPGAADDVHSLARLLFQCTDVVDVVNDPRRRPG